MTTPATPIDLTSIELFQQQEPVDSRRGTTTNQNPHHEHCFFSSTSAAATPTTNVPIAIPVTIANIMEATSVQPDGSTLVTRDTLYSDGSRQVTTDVLYPTPTNASSAAAVISSTVPSNNIHLSSSSPTSIFAFHDLENPLKGAHDHPSHHQHPHRPGTTASVVLPGIVHHNNDNNHLRQQQSEQPVVVVNTCCCGDGNGTVHCCWIAGGSMIGTILICLCVYVVLPIIMVFVLLSSMVHDGTEFVNDLSQSHPD